jgi:hypothetical protein
MLTLPAVILIGLGSLLLLIGGVWGIVVAFRRSVLWGFCYLFVPFAALVFLAVAWAEAKRPFLLNIVGIFLMAAVLLLPNQGGLGLRKAMACDLDKLAPSLTSAPSAVVEAPKDNAMAELTAREQSLLARKAALDPQDLAAARALTDEILQYNADLKAATEGAKTGDASVVSYNLPPK